MTLSVKRYDYLYMLEIVFMFLHFIPRVLYDVKMQDILHSVHCQTISVCGVICNFAVIDTVQLYETILVKSINCRASLVQ